MWYAEIMKCRVQFSAPGCNVFLSLRFNRLPAKKKRKKREGRGMQNINIYCSESPQAVSARPYGKGRMKARTNVGK
jgi:hypothetical protein